MKAYTIITFVVLLSVLSMAGCESSTDPVTQGQISMTAKYSSGPAPQTSIGFAAKLGGTAAVDSIRIDRARFVLRDIKFKTQADSTNFRTNPFVLELNLAGSAQDISIAEVPFGTYRRIEFDVHRVESTLVNTLPVAERAQFQEFLAGDRYSIIINGRTYTAGQAQTFTFRSRINAKQKIDLMPELVVSAGSSAVNATLLLSSADWFKSSGVLLDPADPKNENTISDNLRASIRVFKDNNKDGSKDPN